METSIRIATEADYLAINQIARQTWPVTFGDILSPEQIEYMLDMMYSLDALKQQIVEKGHVFHLLYEDDTPVAYVSHEIDYLPATVKIHKLYALPSSQGKGYGRKLVDRVAAAGRAAGQHRMRLDVNYQNRAVGFYQKLGFDVVDRVDTDIGRGYLMEDYVMEKAL